MDRFCDGQTGKVACWIGDCGLELDDLAGLPSVEYDIGIRDDLEGVDTIGGIIGSERDGHSGRECDECTSCIDEFDIGIAGCPEPLTEADRVLLCGSEIARECVDTACGGDSCSVFDIEACDGGDVGGLCTTTAGGENKYQAKNNKSSAESV